MDTLFQKHESRPQNPLIANAFYRAGFIESWGRGIKKITDACEEYGINTPKYTILPSSVTVEFDSITTQETTQEMSAAQKIIIDCIRNNPFITRKELAEKVGITESGIKYNLGILKKKGILSREGSTKSGKWVIQ